MSFTHSNYIPMKFLKSFLILLISISLFGYNCSAQGLDGIIVERYYLTDEADEANAFENGSVVPLPPGSVVYRVFVDMAVGYKFSQIFGTPDHPLTVNATSDFYNDPSYGVTINPGTISANNIRKHTALIDSWFTTGGASNSKVGILKSEDNDGSVGNQHNVLGNNPGGCYGVPINGANAQDGMTVSSATTYLVPNQLGLSNALEPLDQTPGNSITIDNGALAALGGIVGPTATNRVMIAQLTVDGNISFALNVQLVNELTGQAENYVASNPAAGQLTHPTLTYNSNIAPTVAINSPTNGSNIGFGPYTITADASDNQGYVTAVEFFVDGISIGTDNEAPYEMVYNATVGAHTISATAIDGDCLTATSAVVNVTVANNQSPVITLEAPSSAVSGSIVTLNASASDPDGSITQVQFFVAGELIATDNSAPYTAQWTASLGTDLEIMASATDNSGLTTTSNLVMITVTTNVPPSVTLTAPLSTGDYTAPEVIALMADASDSDGAIVSVEFFVNGESVGVATEVPYTVNWLSLAGPAEIWAVATDSNGASTTSITVNIDVLDPSTEPYAVGSLSQPCNISDFCVPIQASAAFPVSGVIGYDITLNYDPQQLEPLGTAEIFNDMIDANMVNATVMQSAPGEVQVMITLNGNAPQGTQFQGYGNLICVRFNRLLAFGPNDSSEVSVSNLIESYVSGPVEVDVNAGMLYSQPNVFYEGAILYGPTQSALTSNESASTSNPMTFVYGVANGEITNLDMPGEVDEQGFFMHDLNTGSQIEIQRDVDNSASVQKSINGADVMLTKALLNGSFTPDVWQILAMDVNLDGVVSAGDISQMNQRATLMIGEYQQAWNYDSQGNTNGELSKDWIFVDTARLSSPEFALSSSFPDDDLTGFSAARVPAIPFVLSTVAVDFNPNASNCQEWSLENYRAILLGDVNGSYGIDNSNTQDSVVFDLSQAVFTSEAGVNYIEIPIILNTLSADINALDVALKFNQNKLSYVSSQPTAVNPDLVAHYTEQDEFLRITSTTAPNEVLLSGEIAVHVKFAVLDDCAAVFSTDFNSLDTWLNGESVGFRFIDGATLPDPIQIVSSGPYCSGSIVQFAYSNSIDGNSVTDYSWQFGDGSTAQGQSPQVAINGSGVVPITLNLTVENGCTYTIGGEVVMAPVPQVSFTYTFDPNNSEVTFDNTSVILGGSITTYNWDFGDGNQSADADPQHTYGNAGVYTVTLTATSNLGCVSAAEIPVNASVDVTELFSDMFSVYPNPASDRVSIKPSYVARFIITDTTGRMVFDSAYNLGTTAFTIEMMNWPQGIYYIHALAPDQQSTVKLVKIN